MQIPKFLACVLTFPVLIGGSQAQGNAHDIGMDIIGQTPPGLTPELFAPGIVSTDNLEIEGVFAPGMTEFYFVRQVLGDVPKTLSYQYKNGEWQESIVGPRAGEVFISVDGQTMYLGNEYRERTETGWSEPKSHISRNAATLATKAQSEVLDLAWRGVVAA